MTTPQVSDEVTYQNILVERKPPIGLITINRPQVLNALNRQTIQELDRALDELGGDSQVRAIILTGSGPKSFVSGADISGLQAYESSQEGYEHSRYTHRVMYKMQGLSKPVIAAVNGYALGGGCELAMCADIILASENARFGQPEVNLGIIPGFGGTQHLPRLVGRTRALEMILTGEAISAQQAQEIGLVNRVVPAEELMHTAETMARKIAEKAPLAIALAKRAVYEGLESGPRAGNDLETTYFGLAVGTADRREGTSAFLEKRKPEWRGK